MPSTPSPQRRQDDRRLDEFEKKLDDVSDTVGEIRDMLISEPEASPLGRSLLARAHDNRVLIDEIDDRLGVVETWKSEWRGSWRLLTGTAVVLGLIATTFALLNYFGIHLPTVSP